MRSKGWPPLDEERLDEHGHLALKLLCRTRSTTVGRVLVSVVNSSTVGRADDARRQHHAAVIVAHSAAPRPSHPRGAFVSSSRG